MVHMNLENKEILLLTSEEDIASKIMKNVILENFGFNNKENFTEFEVYSLSKNVKLASFKKSLLSLDFLDKQIKADFFIFLSKHKSESGIPGIYIHPIGNFSSENILGGLPNKLCYVSASLMKSIFLNLLEIKEYRNNVVVGLEATHHGPYIESVPCLFVEIGSTEKEWKDVELAKIVVNKVFETINNRDLVEYEAAVCFGGPHYAPSFLKYEMEKEIALSHIISKYSLEKGKISTEMLYEPIRKTVESVKKIILDWKGIKSDTRKILVDFSNEHGIEIIKE